MNGIRNFKRIALDSNIFIYNLEANTNFVKFTDVIFKGLISKQYSAVTSMISLCEILSYPMNRSLEKRIVEDFFATPNLKVLDVNGIIAIEAARIRRKYGFRLPDSVQLATAIEAKAQIFISNDKKLLRFKELEVVLLSSVKGY